MHNLFVDGMRRLGHQHELNSDPRVPDVEDCATPADRLVVRDVERARWRMPGQQREVLVLVGVEAFSYQQAVELLGIPVGTVMSRLWRARERLRAELEKRGAPSAAGEAGHG